MTEIRVLEIGAVQKTAPEPGPPEVRPHRRDQSKLGGDRGVLMCLDETDGSLQWQLVVPKIIGDPPDPRVDWRLAGMCSSATVEGDRVYVVSNRGEVMCLDVDGMADGNDGPFTDEGRLMAGDGQAPLEPTEKDADILWLFDMMLMAIVRFLTGQGG